MPRIRSSSPHGHCACCRLSSSGRAAADDAAAASSWCSAARHADHHRAAILVGCASGPSPTPELARFDPQQGYRFTQTARGADNASSLLVVLTFSGGGTRAAALAPGIL